MAEQEVVLQEKKELPAAGERTEQGKFYSPYTDIYESSDAVVVTMEMPGVERAAIDITLEKNVLTVTGKIDSAKYDSAEPIYSEYNVGNFVRTFTVSTKIDSDKIAANVADGVLTVRLPKAAEAVARRISIG
jgi:HSP20 family molecular chaperone IbpA